MAIIVVGVAAILLVTYLAVDYVATRYRHSRKSIMLLGAEAVLSLLLGLFLALSLVELPWYYHVVFGLVIALPTYAVLSLVTVETWRMLKQGNSDTELSQMRTRLQELQDEADRLAWQIDNLRRKKKALEQEHDEDLFRQRKLKNEIEQWQSGGGMERIRSLRVEDWNSELSQLSTDQLQKRKKELEYEINKPKNSDQYDSLKVQIALVDLELLNRKMREPNKELRELKESVEKRESRRSEVNGEIQQLDQQIRVTVQDRGSTSRKKVELK